MLAIWLTEYENQKYQDDFHDSLLWKLFMFEFVNNYSAFFFLTVWGKWRGLECPYDDCLFSLRQQLATTLLVLCGCTIVEVIVQKVLVMAKLWWEHHQYVKTYGKEPAQRSAIEEQAKYMAIDEEAQVMNTLYLMIALGFLLIFGGVSAIVVPLTFFMFALKMRSFAILCTSYAQRPIPQKTQGIGMWRVVVHFLMSIGVIFSGFLFAAYGQSFQGAVLIARMTGFFAFSLALFVVWGLIDIVIPKTDEATSLLLRRRDHVVTQLTRQSETVEGEGSLSRHLGPRLTPRGGSLTKDFQDEVKQDEWSKIPLYYEGGRNNSKS
jgi:hypothetical protein